MSTLGRTGLNGGKGWCVSGTTESSHRSAYAFCKVSTAREGSMGRRTGISPRLMVSANSEEGATCFLRRRTTTPPITPPAMAPVLPFVEGIVNELVVFPDDVDAAAADDDDNDDVFCSAEDWGDVTTAVGVVEPDTIGEVPEMLLVEEIAVIEEAPPVSGVGESEEVLPTSDAEEDPPVSGVKEDPVVVGDGEEAGVLVLAVGGKALPDLSRRREVNSARVVMHEYTAKTYIQHPFKDIKRTLTINKDQHKYKYCLPCIQSQDAQYEPQRLSEAVPDSDARWPARVISFASVTNAPVPKLRISEVNPLELR
ncbi:hypothetical protein BDR06DRAFT_992747, partial [Suillus hirtellus]